MRVDIECLAKDIWLTVVYGAVTFFDDHILSFVNLEAEVTGFFKMIGSIAIAVYLIYKAIAQITMNKQETEKLKQERYKLEQERIKVEQEIAVLKSTQEIHEFMMNEEKEERRLLKEIADGQKDDKRPN